MLKKLKNMNKITALCHLHCGASWRVFFCLNERIKFVLQGVNARFHRQS